MEVPKAFSGDVDVGRLECFVGLEEVVEADFFVWSFEGKGEHGRGLLSVRDLRG